MKFLLDMNLSPAWVPVLRSAGWERSHWPAVGEAAATDAHNGLGAGERLLRYHQ